MSGIRKLKCATCRTVTTHAAVYDDPARDWREWNNAQRGGPDKGADRDPFAGVAARGVRVHDVEGMEEEVIYVPECSAMFVRAGLSRRRRQIAAEWALSEVESETN